MFVDARRYRETCLKCQLRDNKRIQEELTPTWIDEQWEKIGVDVVHIPKNQGKSYLVAARSDFLGWVEARALARADSVSVARFLYKNVICRYGVLRKVILDGGPENQGLTIKLAEKYSIR